MDEDVLQLQGYLFLLVGVDPHLRSTLCSKGTSLHLQRIRRHCGHPCTDWGHVTCLCLSTEISKSRSSHPLPEPHHQPLFPCHIPSTHHLDLPPPSPRHSTANIRNAFGHAPLHFAAWGRQSASVQVLLQNGADISPLTVRVAMDLLPCPANSCPLHLAAARGHIEISRILLKTFVSECVKLSVVRASLIED